jgi:hypothetical protein
LLLFQLVRPNNRRALRLLFALIIFSLLWLAKVDAAPCSRQAPDAFIQGVSYLSRILPCVTALFFISNWEPAFLSPLMASVVQAIFLLPGLF